MQSQDLGIDMLPNKYFENQRQKRYPPSPPIGITGVICKNATLNISGRGKLSYTVYRPRMLSASSSTTLPGLVIPPPLICVSGGPGMSSQYLSVLVHGVTDRAIVLYDHMGSGQSVPASNDTHCTLESAAADLNELVRYLLMDRPFHLLGHSYGGIVAWEYLQKEHVIPLSLILSNVPFRVDATMERRMELREELGPVRFLQTHECRAVPMPLPLQQSLESLSNGSRRPDTTYHSFQVQGETSVPVLLLVAPYDFVPPDLDLWKSSCPNATIVHLVDCSHYAMVENDALYNDTVSSFVKEHD